MFCKIFLNIQIFCTHLCFQDKQHLSFHGKTILLTDKTKEQALWSTQKIHCVHFQGIIIPYILFLIYIYKNTASSKCYLHVHGHVIILMPPTHIPENTLQDSLICISLQADVTTD